MKKLTILFILFACTVQSDMPNLTGKSIFFIGDSHLAEGSILAQFPEAGHLSVNGLSFRNLQERLSTKNIQHAEVYILYLGTNDIHQGISNNFELHLQKTLNYIKYINPHAKLYAIALPTQYEYGSEANKILRRHVPLIKLPFSNFKEDGIHLVDYEEQARVLVKVRS